MVPGGWFRIVPVDDLVRLARIRIDVPVELDHLWKVDIRKAVSEPPQALRPHLRRMVGEVATRSRKVYTHKGIPADSRDQVPLWKRIEMRDEGSAWRINRDHPVVQWIMSGSASVPEIKSERLLMVQSALDRQAERSTTAKYERLARSNILKYTLHGGVVFRPDIP